MTATAFTHSRHEIQTYAVLPIEVSGLDRLGQFFRERTSTIDTTQSACRFLVKEDVTLESVISIRLVATRGGLEEDARPVLFQVSRAEHTSKGWILDASRLRPDASWSIQSPPPVFR
ncbi:MAG: hypothetical protein WA875_11545 [Candidatus Acidiferrales bacterium]